MNRRAVLVMLAIVVLAALSSWLSQRTTQQQQAAADGPRHVPDYFMSDFAAVTMNAEGRPHYRLEANQAIHYADDQTTTLAQPRLVLFQADAPDWHIRAAQGEISADGNQVYLHGGVEMRREALGKGSLRLTTADMYILPGKQYAETDSPLKITGPQIEIHALGMRAHMDEQQLILRSEVEGSYVPARP